PPIFQRLMITLRWQQQPVAWTGATPPSMRRSPPGMKALFGPATPPPDPPPARQRPEPVLAEQPAPAEGPVITTTTYRVAPENHQAFAYYMEQLGRIRRREGAIGWGLYADLADPNRLMEYFLSESWEEYLRQHQRGVGREEAKLKVSLRQLHEGPERPHVAHLLAQHYHPAAGHPPMPPGSTRLIASTAGEAT
ncbi:MFS transporter, partial [Hymenobacter terrestris]